MVYTVYVMYDKKHPKKDMYTGMTSMALEDRFQRRLSAAKSGKRPELVNEWINEQGADQVGIRAVAKCTTKADAASIEQHRIATRTHVSKGGLNKRMK